MPKENIDLRDYLDKLVNRFYLHIIMLNDELITLKEWFLNKPDGIKTLNIGASFFKVVEKSFKQSFLIELYKFINEKRSLFDFLITAKKNAGAVKPTRFNPLLMVREDVSADDYIAVTKKNLAMLNMHKGTLQNLKSRRNGELAHTDPSFFDNPDEHYQSFPLPDEELAELLDTVGEILREQWLYLKNSDIDLKKVYTTSNLERILAFVRGYERAFQDKTLHEKGVYILKYKWDDYTPG